MNVTVTTIIIAVLAAAAASFAALFLQDRGKAGRIKSKAGALMKELSDLRCEMAGMETRYGDAQVRLSADVVADFLKSGGAKDVAVYGVGEFVTYKVCGESYSIDCSRMPRQMAIRKIWRRDGDGTVTDILEKAARNVTSRLFMVKVLVEDDSYDLLVASADRTLSAFRENYDLYMDVIRDAERMLVMEYRRLRDEFSPQPDAEAMAMSMAQASGGQKKVQS